MTVSTSTLAALQRVDDPFGVLWLLEISGGHLTTPVRLVSDTRDVVSNGYSYIGLPFEVTPPRQADKEVPRAQVRIDNVGRELTADLEALPPGAELTATLKAVYRATPNVVEYKFTASLSSVSVDPLVVNASIGVTDLWRRPAVGLRFDPQTAPGLFPN